MQLILKLLVLVTILATSAIAAPTAQLESDVQCERGVAPNCINPREVV